VTALAIVLENWQNVFVERCSCFTVRSFIGKSRCRKQDQQAWISQSHDIILEYFGAEMFVLRDWC